MTDQSPRREKSRDFDLIGKTIADKYRVLRVLGQGGFGAVYLVEIVAGMLGEKLALKVLPIELSRADTIRERFLNEIRVAMRLVNKYIVQIRDVGVTEAGQLYYTMDFSPGVTLTEVITANKQLPAMKTIALIRRVLRGLVTAHKEGVIHRDLKPGNLMVEDRPEGETVRILDFGIATALQTGRQKARIVGSPLYMPPEQYVGHDIGFYTDLYSVGVILYECLSGQRPYTGKTAKEVFAKMKAGPPRSIQDLCPDVERYPGLGEIVMKSLERDPARRFQSAQEFFNALTAVGKEAHARKAEQEAAGMSASVLARKTRPARRQASPVVILLVKVAMVLGVAAVGYYVFQDDISQVREVVDDTRNRLDQGARRDRPAKPKKPSRPARSDPEPEVVIRDAKEEEVSEDATVEVDIEPEEETPVLTPAERAVKLLASARAGEEESRWADTVDATVQILDLPDMDPGIRRSAFELCAEAQIAQDQYADAADTLDLLVGEFGEEQFDDELLFKRFDARMRGGPLGVALGVGESLQQRGYGNPQVVLMLLEITEKLDDVEKIKIYLGVAKQLGIEGARVTRLSKLHLEPEYTPALIADHARIAEKHYVDGNYVEAIAASASVFKDTKDPNVGYTLARSYFAAHDHPAALHVIEDLNTIPDLAPEQQLRLKILEGRSRIPYVDPTAPGGGPSHVYDTDAPQKSLREAASRLRTLDDLEKRDRKSFEAQIQTHLGLCFAMDGRFDQMNRAVLRNRSALHTEDPELVFEQGLSYLILGRLAPDPKSRKSSLERVVNRMKKFNQLKGRTPDPRGYEIMGIGHFEQGKSDYGKAIKAFKAALRDNEKCAPKVQIDEADLQTRLAQAYEKRAESGNRQTDFRAAGEHFEKAFALREDSDLCFSAARNFLRGDRRRRACEVLDNGLEKRESGRLRQLHDQHCKD